MNYVTYIVAQGDTLESVSYSQLGNDQTDNLILLNNLRYPYISDEPMDQYARPKGTIQLQGAITAGAQSINAGNLNAISINAYDTIFLSDATTGRYECVIVKSVVNSSSNAELTLVSPLENTYTVAAIATVFVNQENIATHVLKAGDTLYLPTTRTGLFSLSSSTNADIYGTDLCINDDGFLSRDGSDLKIVAGLDNLRQACALALQTPYGSYPGDKTYGNRAFEIIGDLNEPYFWNLSEAYCEQTVKSDPRVSGVRNTVLSAQNDSLQIAVDLIPATSQNAVTTNVKIPLRG